METQLQSMKFREGEEEVYGILTKADEWVLSQYNVNKVSMSKNEFCGKVEKSLISV